jgi:hypothetical protein
MISVHERPRHLGADAERLAAALHLPAVEPDGQPHATSLLAQTNGRRPVSASAARRAARELQACLSGQIMSHSVTT